MEDNTYIDNNPDLLTEITEEILDIKHVSVRLLDSEGKTMVASWDDPGKLIAGQMDKELSEQQWRLRDAGMKAKRTNKPLLHRFGIFSFCSGAIKNHGRHIATLCIGPFFRKEKSVLKSHLRDFRREYGLSEKETLHLIDSMPIETEHTITAYVETTALMLGRVIAQSKKLSLQNQTIEKQKNEIEWLSMKKKSINVKPSKSDSNRDYEPFSLAIKKEYMGYVEDDDRKRANQLINHMLCEIIIHAQDQVEDIKTTAIDWFAFLLKVASDNGVPLENLSTAVNKIPPLIEGESKEQVSVLLSESINLINDLLFKRKGNKNGNYHLTTAIIYIRNHYREKVTLDDVADACSISSYYLSRLFRDEMGVSFIDYLHNIRMEEARRLLRENEQTIYETALNCGFSDPNYFSKTFKKYMGMTPSSYQSQYRGETVG